MNWNKVTDKREIIELILQIEKLEKKVRDIDDMALNRYRIECLNKA
jgi:hypothetical protein